MTSDLRQRLGLTERNVMHTPTPWHLEGRFAAVYVTDEDGCLVADCDHPARLPHLDTENQLANAHFIVTAANSHQALVDALEAFLGAMDTFPAGCITTEAGIQPLKNIAAAERQARAALRLARSAE